MRSRKDWIQPKHGAAFTGNNIAKSYRKHFGVDWPCAFKELAMLGVEIDPEYQKQVLQSTSAQAEAKQRKKREREAASTENLPFDQDDNFAFIAGYTSGGFTYGITWEEWEKMEDVFRSPDLQD